MKVLYQFERFWEIQTEVQPSLNWENQKNVHCIEIVKFFAWSRAGFQQVKFKGQ
jgi:hypothetical protein